MRWMGLDYGDKTIGVAISDELGWTAQGLEVIHRVKAWRRYCTAYKKLSKNMVLSQIVVGLPKNMNNTIGPRGEIAIAFSQELEQKTKCTSTLVG